MNIVIVNGETAEYADRFDGKLDDFKALLEERGAEVTVFTIRGMNIGHCVGCFSCWFRTPGLCALKDDMPVVLRAYARADLIIWASRLILGNISFLAKKTQDRFIPFLLPHVTFYKKEVHHPLRYGKCPDLGLIVEPDENDVPADLDLLRRLFDRFSLNTRSRFRFFAKTADLNGEAANEACTL